MKLLRIAGIVAIAALFSLIPACGPSGKPTGTPTSGGKTTSGGKPKVAFVSNNPEQFWTIAEAGTTKAAADFDADVIFRRPQGGTAAAQKEIVEDLITQGVQAIAISVIDPKNQMNFLNDVAGKVKLLTVDNDASESKRLCYLGTNNLEAGRAVGELVEKAMPQGGKLAIFVGQLDPINAQERRQGVLDRLAGKPSKDLTNPRDGETYGKFQLIGTYTDNVSAQKSKENAADVLTKTQNEPNLCLVGLWAYNPPAILSAVKDANRLGKVKIVGFDEMDDTLQGISDGHIEATVVQNPYKFGYESVRVMTSLLRKPDDKSVLPANGLLYVPHRVIRKGNPVKEDDVLAFRDELHRLLGKK